MDNIEELAEKLEKALSKVIQDTLVKRGVSQTQFAKKLSISQSNLNRLLRNEISYRVSHLIEISSQLNMTFQKLITLAMEENEKANPAQITSLDERQQQNVSEPAITLEPMAANSHTTEEEQPSYHN